MAEVIMDRLLDLEAAATLADMAEFPGRLHQLTADRSGQFALDLRHPYRLIIEPDHTPVPTESGTILRNQVTRVEVVGIVDYH